MLKFLTLSALAVAAVGFGAAPVEAALVSITGSNFTQIDPGGGVSNTNTNLGHEAFEYIGPIDALSSDATFEIDVTYDTASTGAALWFGTATSAQWFNFEGPGNNRITHFSGRNLTVPSGGSSTILATYDPAIATRLVVDRSISGSTITLDLEVFDGTTSLYAGSVNYTAAATESWGFSTFSFDPTKTLTVNSINVNVVPEPSSLALLGIMGTIGFFRRRRPSSLSGRPCLCIFNGSYRCHRKGKRKTY